MAIDKDVQAAVAKIDNRIAKLNTLRELLLDEFGQEEPQAGSDEQTSSRPRRQRTARLHRNGSRRPAQDSRRRDQVVAFLRQHGPARRGQIVEGTGIPVGTISYVLNDEDTFGHTEDGRWALISE